MSNIKLGINDQYVEQLEKGIEVEYEHTVNYHIAKKIAKDHLAEIPDYDIARKFIGEK